MRAKSAVVLTACLFSSLVAFAQAQSAPPAAQNGQKTAVAVPVIVLRGTLNKGLNSKSATSGQTFVVKTADALKLTNGTEIPVDSDISGHVLQCSARANGAPESTLVLTFDTLQPKGAPSALPIRGIVQAITGPATISAPRPQVGDMSTESVGGGATGARIPSDQVRADKTVGGSGGELNERSAGVIGIKNMTLQTGPVNGVDGSTFASADKSLRL